VFEPLDPERIPDQRNIQVVVTEPGCVRGHHYHRGPD
jgi:dTDP-4-dehydrorhamnose 3,5-epimerase-like enzyme